MVFTLLIANKIRDDKTKLDDKTELGDLAIK